MTNEYVEQLLEVTGRMMRNGEHRAMELRAIACYIYESIDEERLNIAYFAKDGNYGNAKDLIITDVSKWSEDDWIEIEMATDEERVSVVKAIMEDKGEVL